MDELEEVAPHMGVRIEMNIQMDTRMEYSVVPHTRMRRLKRTGQCRFIKRCGQSHDASEIGGHADPVHD